MTAATPWPPTLAGTPAVFVIEQAIARVTSSQANVQAQSQALATTKQQLDSDLTSWEKDLAAATATATAFDDRFRAATIELSGMETSIVRLGKELGEAWAVLTETIEQASR
jgi:septal ring factor EnvC (AmiA/AmiB activator)